MSSENLEAATRLITHFLEFARSRPSIEDLARALSRLGNVPKHATIAAELESALQEVQNLYPDEHRIELRLALLPALIDDNYRASQLLEQFVHRFSANPLGYIQRYRDLQSR